jgi:hypothetical protein
MAFWNESTVYRSSDEAACRKYGEALQAAGIRVRIWSSEEVPVSGCCSNIDMRKVIRGTNRLNRLYAIDVPNADAEKARTILGPAALRQ